MLAKTTQLLTVAVALLIPFGAHANDIHPDFEFQNVHMTTAEMAKNSPSITILPKALKLCR